MADCRCVIRCSSVNGAIVLFAACDPLPPGLLFIIYNYANGLNDVVIVVFLIAETLELLKNFKYLVNAFYLERLLYDNYYNGIVYDASLESMRIDKYYYFKNDGIYLGEKKYLLNNRFK